MYVSGAPLKKVGFYHFKQSLDKDESAGKGVQIRMPCLSVNYSPKSIITLDTGDIGRDLQN
jgi:hypothetical protein